jgi:hypothetical protein
LRARPSSAPCSSCSSRSVGAARSNI